MKFSMTCAFVVATLALCIAAAPAGKSEKPAKKDDAKSKPINAKCPIQGEDIDPKVTTTYKGKTVAFCCESCIDDFKKDPDKYVKQIEAENKKAEDAKKKGQDKGKSEGKAEGKAVKTVNAMCLVHGDDAVDPTVTTVYKGKVIGFCCEDCQKKFDADPEAYAAKLK